MLYILSFIAAMAWRFVCHVCCSFYFDNSRFGALLSIPYSLYYSIFKGIITKKSTVLITYYF